MSARWWWFRVVLLGLVGLGLGAYLVGTTRWSAFFGRPGHEGVIREGDPIVEAVYRFKGERAVWPEYLEDLAPEYLPGVPGPRWFYELQPSGAGGVNMQPVLSTVATEDGPRAHVGFDFAQPSWRVFGMTEGRVLRVGRAGAVTVAATSPREAVVAKELAELERRIGRERDVMEHRAGMAALLLSMGREADARAVIEAAGGQMPQHFWPRLALASLDLLPARAEATTRPASMRAFIEWAEAHPSFTHWYYLSVLYRQAGSVEEAAGAMKAALGQEIAVGPDDGRIPAFYLWDMARWAVREQRWALAIEICDAWERAPEKVAEEKSYLALRAAARLASGDQAGAGADLKALPPGMAPWARNGVSLREAVRRNDRAYRYDPGDMPGNFAVFPLPE